MGMLEELLEEVRTLRNEVKQIETENVLPNGKAVLSVDEAAELLNISRENFMAQVKTGEWPFIKSGRRYKFPAKELLDRLEEKAHGNMKKTRQRLNISLI